MQSCAPSNCRIGLVLALAGLVILGNIAWGPSDVFAQTTVVRKPNGKPLEPPALKRLPAALLKRVPESIADLQQIEDRVQSLVKQITACTVALRVGPAQGSGVLVSAGGLILTAAHVSGPPGRRIEIALPDGSVAFGKTLGGSRVLDASLVKIDGSDRTWPFVKMADIGGIRQGDWCLVTGHPGGYVPDRPPVIRLGRVVAITDRLIQTDCELVGGDSGGPLFDMRGQVIGINSRIGEDTSLNLHVPIGVYSNNWERLVASQTFGDQSRAFLGVVGEPTDGGGVKLTKIWSDQPAEAAGMEVGDVLLTFEGVTVQSMEQLRELVEEEDPGRPVRVTLRRGQEVLEMFVKLGSREE